MSEQHRIELVINGRSELVTVPSNWTLLQLLRDRFHMLGTEEGCGEGSCGSCTVLLDDRLARSCITLAVRAAGRRVRTVEGLGVDGELHHLQQAFVDDGAIQCGFCTPGFLMSSLVLLRENPHPSDDEIREYLSGNFCRCGGYFMIIDAVRQAAGSGGDRS